MSNKIYYANIVNPISETEINILPNSYLVLSDEGKIVYVGDNYINQKSDEFFDYKDHFILPGFIDCHVHLPQHSFAGLGADELLPWLNNYTFPMEKLFSNSHLAQKSSQIFFKNLIKVGTTTAVVYATSHTEACDISFKEAEKSGLRIFLGKVLMDRNAPEELLQEHTKALEDCEALIKKWHLKNNEKLQFIITPRFAITCTKECLTKSALLAKKYNLFIQTHMSENKNEISYTKSLFPEYDNYADIYNKTGLLTNKTLLGHGIFLEPKELELLKINQSSIIHCPTSNRYLQSGVFPYSKVEQHNIKIAFGTDIAGGYNLCMLDEMREVIETSKAYNILENSNHKILNWQKVIYNATLGAAKILKLDDKIGNFALNKDADFIILSDKHINLFNEIGVYSDYLSRINRLIYCGTTNALIKTFVKGQEL